MSGGIDSCCLTYVAKEQFGLRPLVFHVDAGWNSRIAVNNIEKLVDNLDNWAGHRNGHSLRGCSKC